jgi:hypothetical protein
MSFYKPLIIIIYLFLPYTSISSPLQKNKNKKQNPEKFYNTE